MKKLFTILITSIIFSCTGIPDNVTPVKNFEISKYMGEWYEIARLDHSFERGLKNISANYSLREDGGVNVLNRGYSIENKEWNEAKGKAYFVREADEGYLKVSFFGPFYGSYIIFELDKKNYQYAFISGPDLSYLWLLSRTPSPPQAIIDKFIQQSESLGFNLDELIFVNHDDN